MTTFWNQKIWDLKNEKPQKWIKTTSNEACAACSKSKKYADILKFLYGYILNLENIRPPIRKTSKIENLSEMNQHILKRKNNLTCQNIFTSTFWISKMENLKNRKTLPQKLGNESACF